MNLRVKLTRKLTDWRFALLRLAVIEDIPTNRFNAIVKEHTEAGWTTAYRYEGFDAWIDYGRIDLRQGRCKLRFEWDNWTEGQISGPKAVIEALALKHGFAAATRMRWMSLED
jgi:YD repeat-containing protein